MERTFTLFLRRYSELGTENDKIIENIEVLLREELQDDVRLKRLEKPTRQDNVKRENSRGTDGTHSSPLVTYSPELLISLASMGITTIGVLIQLVEFLDNQRTGAIRTENGGVLSTAPIDGDSTETFEGKVIGQIDDMVLLEIEP